MAFHSLSSDCSYGFSLNESRILNWQDSFPRLTCRPSVTGPSLDLTFTPRHCAQVSGESLVVRIAVLNFLSALVLLVRYY